MPKPIGWLVEAVSYSFSTCCKFNYLLQNGVIPSVSGHPVRLGLALDCLEHNLITLHFRLELNLPIA